MAVRLARQRRHDVGRADPAGVVPRARDVFAGDPARSAWHAELIGKLSRQTCTPDTARALADIWYQTDVRGALPSVQVSALLTAQISSDEGVADRQGSHCGSGITYVERGEYELKGVPDSWWLYTVGR